MPAEARLVEKPLYVIGVWWRSALASAGVILLEKDYSGQPQLHASCAVAAADFSGRLYKRAAGISSARRRRGCMEKGLQHPRRRCRCHAVGDGRPPARMLAGIATRPHARPAVTPRMLSSIVSGRRPPRFTRTRRARIIARQWLLSLRRQHDRLPLRLLIGCRSQASPVGRQPCLYAMLNQ